LPRDDLPEDVPERHMVQEMITFLTMDGNIVKVPGRKLPVLTTKPRSMIKPMPTWEEQKLCIGASFLVAATNGYDPARRINVEGFCQSVDLLFESVEDAVRTHRGEILVEERQLKSGLHEVLKLTVAIPLLWGVPPTFETLSSAIQTGGGIVHRVYHQWNVY